MDRRSRRNPEWKRGLRKGLLGLMLVLGAFFWRKNQEAGQQIRTGSDAVRSAEADPADLTGRETKRLALTFDDGPHPYYTDLLLDGLADRGVKATFFLLGENIEGREDIIRRMHEEGHLIGNHTFYHVDVNSLPLKEACAEIQDTSSAISAITGQQVEYVRPPYGSWNKELECEVLMIPVFWTLDTLDWKVKNADQIVREVLADVEENDVILMHDSYRTTVDAALRIVDALQEKGYEFVTADELILE